MDAPAISILGPERFPRLNAALQARALVHVPSSHCAIPLTSFRPASTCARAHFSAKKFLKFCIVKIRIQTHNPPSSCPIGECNPLSNSGLSSGVPSGRWHARGRVFRWRAWVAWVILDCSTSMNNFNEFKVLWARAWMLNNAHLITLI